MKAPELTVEESIDVLLAPPAPTAVPNDALKFAFEVTYGYVHKISDRFKPGLAFSDRGLARAASVFGWLCGLSQGGNVELANELAADFVSNLDYLAKYGGEVDYSYFQYDGTPATRKIPAYVVKLCDDGTAHGFALLWHRPLLTDEIVENHKALGRNVVTFGYDGIPHGYVFNGGLIYHGPGAGQTFTVNTGSRSWGVHT